MLTAAQVCNRTSAFCQQSGHVIYKAKAIVGAFGVAKGLCCVCTNVLMLRLTEPPPQDLITTAPGVFHFTVCQATRPPASMPNLTFFILLFDDALTRL